MSTGLFGKNDITGSFDAVGVSDNNLNVAQYVWDVNTLSWVKQTGSSGAVGTEVVVTNLPATQQVAGTVNVTPTTRATRFDQASEFVAYAGVAAVGTSASVAAWQLKKIDTNAEGDVTVTFADGNANFDNFWDNRTSYSYS